MLTRLLYLMLYCVMLPWLGIIQVAMAVPYPALIIMLYCEYIIRSCYVAMVVLYPVLLMLYCEYIMRSCYVAMVVLYPVLLMWYIVKVLLCCHGCSISCIVDVVL